MQALSLSNGNINYNMGPLGGRRRVNTVATFSCDSGYSRSGPSSRTCQSSGNWNRQAVTCNQGNESNILLLSLMKVKYFVLLM